MCIKQLPNSSPLESASRPSSRRIEWANPLWGESCGPVTLVEEEAGLTRTPWRKSPRRAPRRPGPSGRKLDPISVVLRALGARGPLCLWFIVTSPSGGVTGGVSPQCDQWEEGLAGPATSREVCKESNPSQRRDEPRPARLRPVPAVLRALSLVPSVHCHESFGRSDGTCIPLAQPVSGRSS